MQKSILAIIALAFISYTHAQVEFSGACPSDVKVQCNFNVSAYLGVWYEYAKYPVYFEAEGKCVKAEYTLKANGEVGVLNSMINAENNDPSNIVGYAVEVENAKLKVTFPVSPSFNASTNYWVLSTDYDNYSVVYSCQPADGNSHYKDALAELDAAETSDFSSTTKPNIEPTVRIKCLSGSMLITIKDAPLNHETGLFSGMIYPKGLSKNSTCLTEYRDHDGPLRYKLPLRSCNTMPQETDDGGIEFFNTIVLQPHLKLITDAGRGYHVRCSYKSRDAATSSPNKKHTQRRKANSGKHAQKPQAYRSAESASAAVEVSGDRRDYGRSLDKYRATGDEFDRDDLLEDGDDDALDEGNDETLNEIPMPGCHMKIYNSEHKIADDVKIGDPLTIVISIDKQELYGLHVTDCIVRDGLGWGEQRLLSEDGCPMDNEIMGQFNYSSDHLAANVTFPAHKFPYTTSVYYQCNVHLCALQDPECQLPPACSGKRPKRQTNNDNKDEDGQPATIEVYSGLYVNENVDVSESDDDTVLKERTLEDALCVSQRTFAIAIAIAGLILMLAVVAAVLCIMARRSTKSVSNSGSSIYSGPYTNTAFSHSS